MVGRVRVGAGQPPVSPVLLVRRSRCGTVIPRCRYEWVRLSVDHLMPLLQHAQQWQLSAGGQLAISPRYFRTRTDAACIFPPPMS